MKSANWKIVRAVLCMLMVLFLFAGCARKEDSEPTIPRFQFLRQKAQTLTVAATAEDFELLQDCINLQYLDLTGSTCYDEILNYVNSHPQVEVVYTAPLGDLTLSNSHPKASLKDGSYQFDSLKKQLKYLPKLTMLDLPVTCLTLDELNALREEYPNLQITYTIDLFGKEYTPAETVLDLSSVTASELEASIEKLKMLPELKEITLPDDLSIADVISLKEQFPNADFHYTFTLFDQTFTTADTSMAFQNAVIGNSGIDQIRSALDIMPHCTSVRVENCGVDNEVMAQLRADYPNANVAWRVHFGGQYSLMTDDTTLRTVYGVENSHNDILKYCTGLKYIDMGHNTTLTDISFASYMPDLEILILSGCSVRNVDPLAACKNLVFLEMANCYALEDISALKHCESLRFLNIGFSKVTDLTPIQDLPLERFVCLGPQMDQETQTAFEESHPDCWVRFTGQNPLSLGWKYDDVGVTRSEYYQFIREVFDLDEVDRRLARQAALEEDEDD